MLRVPNTAVIFLFRGHDGVMHGEAEIASRQSIVGILPGAIPTIGVKNNALKVICICVPPDDVYREVKVGAVFEASCGPERSGLAPGAFVDQAGEKHYVARHSKVEDEGLLLYALAVRYGLHRAHQLVVLGDGAVWIWRLVAEHFPSAVQIVDMWHAREHVWKVARAVFGPNTPEASSWAGQACSLLVEGKIEDLVTEIVVLTFI